MKSSGVKRHPSEAEMPAHFRTRPIGIDIGITVGVCTESGL